MADQVSPLPNTLGEVVQRVQSLLAGNTASVGIYQRPYLLPFINQAYSEMAKRIKAASGQNLGAVIEVLNVPQGTSDLSPYQKYDGAPPNKGRGPLAGLYNPIRIWTKTAGQLPQYYTQAWKRATLPFVNPPGITPGTYAVQVTWAWIGRKLSITPVAGPIDIQVYGRFNVPRLQKDEDELLLDGDMTDTLASATIAWTGIERSNTTILQAAETRAISGVDDIVADIIRQGQDTPSRLGMMGGRGGSAWGWGNFGGVS